jgi:hypothetical protein
MLFETKTGAKKNKDEFSKLESGNMKINKKLDD